MSPPREEPLIKRLARSRAMRNSSSRDASLSPSRGVHFPGTADESTSRFMVISIIFFSLFIWVIRILPVTKKIFIYYFMIYAYLIYIILFNLEVRSDPKKFFFHLSQIQIRVKYFWNLATANYRFLCFFFVSSLPHNSIANSKMWARSVF